MAQYRALDPAVEVNGETVLSVVHGVGPRHDTARRILEQTGIKDPRAGQWYSQQA